MTKKILMICALTLCGFISLQAMEKEEGEKDLSPGAFVCNAKEDKCLKDSDQEESSSSALFAVFGEDHDDEIKLLACKDCR